MLFCVDIVLDGGLLQSLVSLTKLLVRFLSVDPNIAFNGAPLLPNYTLHYCMICEKRMTPFIVASF